MWVEKVITCSNNIMFTTWMLSLQCLNHKSWDFDSLLPNPQCGLRNELAIPGTVATDLLLCWVFYFVYMPLLEFYSSLLWLVVCLDCVVTLFVCYVAFVLGLKCFVNLILDTSDHLPRLHSCIYLLQKYQFLCEVWSSRMDSFRYEAG